MSTRKALIAAAVALIAIAAAAWALEYTLARPASGAAYSVAVTRAGRTLKAFTLEDLRALGTKRVFMQGKYQEGPTVLDVLAAAGVDSFDSLSIRGEGLRDEGRLTLPRSSIDGDVLLAIANRGTVKICGTSIPQEERVRDVLEIDVR